MAADSGRSGLFFLIWITRCAIVTVVVDIIRRSSPSSSHSPLLADSGSERVGILMLAVMLVAAGLIGLSAAFLKKQEN